MTLQADHQLVSLLAHDLRNPLGAIRNAVHILSATRGGDAQSAWAISLIERQLDELLGIIDAVSDASRLSRGVVEFAREPFPIGAAVADAVTASEPMLARKEQRCDVTMQGGESMAQGDRGRCEQAVRALVACASKSLTTGAVIALDVGVAGDYWTVRVRPGAAERARDAPIAEILARALAERMGGTLAAEPAAYELSLPLSRHP